MQEFIFALILSALPVVSNFIGAMIAEALPLGIARTSRASQANCAGIYHRHFNHGDRGRDYSRSASNSRYQLVYFNVYRQFCAFNPVLDLS